GSSRQSLGPVVAAGRTTGAPGWEPHIRARHRWARAPAPGAAGGPSSAGGRTAHRAVAGPRRGPRGPALLMTYYLDTSALVKLVAPEPESDALRQWLEARAEALVTSDLARTELFRAVRRVLPESAPLARQVLDTLTVLRLETSVFEEA